MWIVRLALRRPYTFVVMAVLIAILGGSAIVTMPVDIFPYIDIPVVSVVWSYGGLSPEEMEKRMVTIFERSMTTTVNDIEHIESQSYSGVSVTRVYFQPNAKVELALSQVTAICQTLLQDLPARDHAAQHHQVRRLQRAHSATRPGKQDRSASRNCSTWGRTSSAPSWPPSRARPFRSPYGGKFRAGHGGSQSRAAFRQGPLPRRRLHRAGQPEPDPSRRRRQDRRQGLPGAGSTAARGFWTS